MEEQIKPIKLSGTNVPHWLRGILIRNGPAMFEIGASNVGHQFDGFSKLYKFNFTKNGVFFQSRFLNSEIFKKTLERGALVPHIPYYPVFPKFNYIDRLMSFFQKTPLDNNNINIHSTGSKVYATSDISDTNLIDVDTLDVIGKLNDKYSNYISAAHPQSEIDGNGTFNYLCDPTTNLLRLYKDDEDGTRTMIGKVKLEHVPLMHSFAVTRDFVILFQYPFSIDAMGLLFGASSMIEIMRWFGQTSRSYVSMFVFDAHATSMKLPLQIYKLPSFFSMHCINAFQKSIQIDEEEITKVVVDLITYKDATFVSSSDTYGQLDLMRNFNLRQKSESYNIVPKTSRIVIHIPNQMEKVIKFGKFFPNIENKVNACTMQEIESRPFEMPNINSKFKGRDYQFVYGVTTKDMYQSWGITKTNLRDASQSMKWNAPKNHFPNEPIFIEFSNTVKEDDGILVIVVLDAEQNRSYISYIDARSMTEIGKSYLPGIVPFDVHGKWLK